jgi:hypothetical protein
MDRTISTAAKNNLFGSTWKSDIDVLKDIKEKSSAVKNIEIYLPYAAYREKNSKSGFKFIHIDKEKYDNIIKNNLHKVFYANLFLREGFNKQIFGIELTADAVVVPQLYKRNYGYYYEWNKHELTIRRILGTYDHKKIKNMVEELMSEYKRFYWMYCETN